MSPAAPAAPSSMSAVLDLLIPWITLGIVTLLLLNVRQWILRHIFGVSWLASRERNMAVVIYLIALLPGALLRELSRYMMAGAFRIRPAFVTFTPQVGDDGIVDLRFIHFIILNPVFAGLVALAPFLTGMGAMLLIATAGLGLPDVIALAGSGEAGAVRAALDTLLGRENFLLWAYTLFGVANTMLPTASELRATWIFWIVLGLFFAVLMVVGLWGAIYLLLAGPVTAILYTLATIFAAVLAVNLIVAAGVWIVERLLEALTNQKVEYRPAEATKAARTASVPHSVADIRLPVPPIPAKMPPITVTTPVLPAPAERPGLPARPAAASIPARATGTDLPAVPEKAAPPPPRPASPLPSAPPSRAPAAAGMPDAKPASAPVPQPARPGFQTGEMKPAPLGAPFNKPSEPPKPEPARPAAPAALTPARTSGLFGAKSDKPDAEPPASKPAASVPAIARPSAAAPLQPPGKPAPYDKPIVDRPAPKPAPKPTGPPSAFGARSPSSFDDQDVIDADVIDEQDNVVDAEIVDEPPRPAPFRPAGGSPGGSPFGPARSTGTGTGPAPAFKPPAGQAPPPAFKAPGSPPPQAPKAFGGSPFRPAPKSGSTPSESDKPGDDKDDNELKYEKLDTP